MKIMTAEEANRIMGAELYPNVAFPEGFREKLEGKTLEEQMEHFRITTSATTAKTAYGEITEENTGRTTCRLQDFPEFRGLVVHDGIIVGAVIRQWAEGEVPVRPYEGVCTYIGIDNEGSGTSERNVVAYLICV